MTVFALEITAGLAALGRRFIPGITRLLARATVFAVVTTPAASATMAAAVVAGLAVAAELVALATAVGANLRCGGFFGEEGLKPAEEAAGLFGGGGGGGGTLGAVEIALTVTLAVTLEGGTLGAFAGGGGFAAGFAGLERTGLAAVTATRAERRTFGTTVVLLAGGVFAPADGGALHFLGGEDVELGLGGGRGGLSLGRRGRREREQLGLGGRSRRGSRSGYGGRGHDRLSHGGRGGDGRAFDHGDGSRGGDGSGLDDRLVGDGRGHGRLARERVLVLARGPEDLDGAGLIAAGGGGRGGGSRGRRGSFAAQEAGALGGAERTDRRGSAGGRGGRSGGRGGSPEGVAGRYWI